MNSGSDNLDFLISPLKKSSLSAWNSIPTKINKQKRKREVYQKILESQTYHSKKPLGIEESTDKLIQKHYTIKKSSIRTTNSPDFFQNIRDNRNIKEKVERPIIQITVIPKAAETQTSKIFNKRIYKKKIITTASNQDSSIRGENVYLASGRLREKVKELKASESENLSVKWKAPTERNIYKQRSIQYFDYLAMEKKKPRNRRYKDGRLYNGNEGDRKTPLGDHIHNDQKENTSSKLNLTSPKSRVTIVGRLGLTDDDRYVLNCAATVDDKPIPTNVTHYNEVTKRPRPYTDYVNQYPGGVQMYGMPKNYSVCNARVDNTPNANQFSDTRYENVPNYNRSESQGIQVNLNLTNRYKSNTTKDKCVQCRCQDKENSRCDDGNEHILKKCNSPIVVISVYPKSEKGDASPGHTIKIEQQNTLSQKYGEKEYGISKNFKDINSNSRDRLRSTSPDSLKFSPQRPTGYQKINNRYNTDNNLRGRSPSKSPIRTAQFIKSKKTISKQDVTNQSNINHLNRSRPSKKSFSHETGTETQNVNTSRNLAKKALVDSYINKLNTEKGATTSTRKRFLRPKDDASKVTINIDGETEQYNLVFEQNKRDTNLAVRKFMKDPNSQKKRELEGTGVSGDLLKYPKDRVITSKIISESRTPSPVNNKNGYSTLNKKPSKLRVRDSIEISHRRGSFGGSPKEISTKKSTDDSSKSMKAQIKHYRGDDCCVTDPNERDKEIRQLLGLLTGKKYKAKVESPLLIEGIFPECKDYEDTSCLNERISIPKIPMSKRVETFFKKIKISKAGNPNNDNISTGQDIIEHRLENRYQTEKGNCKKELKSTVVAKQCRYHEDKNQYEAQTKYDDSFRSRVENQLKKRCPSQTLLCSQCNESATAGNALNGASLVLNRNIQVFLELEQFTKQKPIILNRHQYNKVKKTIQSTISKKTSNDKKRCCSSNNYSLISIGDFRVRSKFRKIKRISKEVQTDAVDNYVYSEFLSSMEGFDCQEASPLNQSFISMDEHNQSKYQIMSDNSFNAPISSSKVRSTQRDVKSTMEMRYASVSIMKHVAYSSPNYNNEFENSISRCTSTPNKSYSLHTLFKGFKKTVTPNLGTSGLSLCSETNSGRSGYNDRFETQQLDNDPKHKKPLLQRLVSCLIMRSTRVSEMKIGKKTPQRRPMTTTSTDSYYFSSSLAGVQIPSSIYDTSISFFTNHTVYPINKMKRSFFSSMREFLTNRRN